MRSWFTRTGLPPDGFDQPQSKILFGVLHDNMAGAVLVFVDVM